MTGEATLTSYYGDEATYAASGWSFELATNDPNLTRNDVDVEYQGNLIVVNTVTDDQSFVVDLGDVPLEEAPAEVSPDEFPLGNWEKHDALGALLGHTYWVRTLDGDSRGVNVFKIVKLSPGASMTIRWYRSLNPDAAVPPTKCGV